jgi:hypothetical protein
MPSGLHSLEKQAVRKRKYMSITQLEFVLGRVLGPPVFRSNGTSYWNCPNHSPDENPSFHTLPHREEYPDKFKCFACDFWGDEFDILKLKYPNRDFGWRESKLITLFAEYRQEHPDGVTLTFRGAQASNKKPIKKESRK